MYNTKVRINFFDTDPGGVIFYSNLLKFAHVGYEELFNSFDLYHKYFLEGEFIIPIIHAEADYLKPIRAGDQIKIMIELTRLENSSFELSYVFKNAQNETAAKARTVHVMVNKNSFKKTDIPEDLKFQLENLKV
jgi:1,4-dihydroxy-2-naphthoyl-CoA hydrolase